MFSSAPNPIGTTAFAPSTMGGALGLSGLRTTTGDALLTSNSYSVSATLMSPARCSLSESIVRSCRRTPSNARTSSMIAPTASRPCAPAPARSGDVHAADVILNGHNVVSNVVRKLHGTPCTGRECNVLPRGT